MLQYMKNVSPIIQWLGPILRRQAASRWKSGRIRWANSDRTLFGSAVIRVRRDDTLFDLRGRNSCLYTALSVVDCAFARLPSPASCPKKIHKQLLKKAFWIFTVRWIGGLACVTNENFSVHRQHKHTSNEAGNLPLAAIFKYGRGYMT